VCRALILSQIQKQIKKVAIKTIDQFKYCDRKDDGIAFFSYFFSFFSSPIF